jgi:ribosomal-protein-alanine N-acetyltransferase
MSAPSLPLLPHQPRTPRLQLIAPQAVDWQVAAVQDFHSRNTAHFAPWDPPRPANHLDPVHIRSRLADLAQSMAMGLAWRWWLVAHDDPQRVIGSVSFTGIERGPFHNAQLGYSIDVACQGQGLMTEALQVAMARAFAADGLNLHRVQAGVQPANQRSVAVLQRLGFVLIGEAPQYLFINGAWRDHLLFARINPDFVNPAAWSAA